MTIAKHLHPLPCAEAKRTALLSGKSLRCSRGLAFPYFTGGIKKPANQKTQQAKPGFSSGGGRHGSLGSLSATGSMKRQKLISFRPFRLRYLAAAKFGNGAGCNFDFIGNLRLRHASCLDFRNDLVPVHCNSFSISRNHTLRLIEMQVCNHQKMSLAERLIEARWQD